MLANIFLLLDNIFMAVHKGVHEALGDEEMIYTMAVAIKSVREDPEFCKCSDEELGRVAFTAAVKKLGRSYSYDGNVAVINAAINLNLASE